MEYVNLGNIVDIYLGITHTPEYVSKGVPFLSVKDISKGKIDFSNCKYISIDEFNSFPKGAKPQKRDILFGRVGTIGKPIIISEGTPEFGSFVSLGYLRLKSEEWNPEFIKYWMESNLFKKQVKQNTKGASQVNLNTTWLKKFLIPSYSIENQKIIVKELNQISDYINKSILVIKNLDNIVKSQFIELINHSTEKNVLSDFVKKCKIEKCKDETLPPLSITKDEGFVLQEEKFNKRIASKDISTYKVIPYGKLVMGLHIDEGAFAVQNIVPLGIVSPAYKVWDIKKELVVPAVLQYALRTDESITYYKSKFKGATVERRNPISENDLMNTPLNLPKMEEQIKFSLICQQIDKSQFIEMFGDVIRNDKKFEECSFKDFVNQMNIGPFGSDLKNNCFVSKKEGYCVVYEQKNAIEKNTNGDFKYISKDKYEKMKRFDVGPGDIIVSCRGTIGKCFVLPNNAPHGIIHSSLMMIKPKKEVNNKFLVFLLENILSEQNELGSGVKMAIKANELAKIKTIRPSKKLQDEFIDIVEQIDKSKYFGGAEYGIC